MTDQDTRHRILLAAAGLFVERGFQKTTVRSICEAAAANVAAVNYHFRDKAGLYGAVIQYAIEQKPEVGDLPDAHYSERLRAWVSALLHSCIGEEPDLLAQIMANEMTSPTDFLAVIVEQVVGPKMALLQEIIVQGIGPDATSERIQLIAMSVVGQALMYDHSRPVVCMIMPAMDYSKPKLDGIVDHITRASVGMIEAFKEPSDFQ
jgi:AcrR family transcriptional regulator